LNELFALAMWAAMAARITCLAFWGQATKLAPVMHKVRRDILPVLTVPVFLVLLGVAPFTQAHSMPQQETGGTSKPDRGTILARMFEGISLDEAVSRAERQYNARVVRTDVQDEDGRKVYVLKLLSADGRVFTVRIDAATGRMR
jgi:hypothetical protein